MNRLLSSFIPVFFIFISTLFPISAYAQQAVTEQYKYDPLGRLMIVEANNQLKVSYCYDKAGNRTDVSTEDCYVSPSVHPGPPKPTSLNQGSHQGGGCYIRWSSPADAGIDHFQVRLTKGYGVVNVAGNRRYMEHSAACFTWIRACDAQGACSQDAYF